MLHGGPRRSSGTRTCGLLDGIAAFTLGCACRSWSASDIRADVVRRVAGRVSGGATGRRSAATPPAPARRGPWSLERQREGVLVAQRPGLPAARRAIDGQAQGFATGKRCNAETRLFGLPQRPARPGVRGRPRPPREPGADPGAGVPRRPARRPAPRRVPPVPPRFSRAGVKGAATGAGAISAWRASRRSPARRWIDRHDAACCSRKASKSDRASGSAMTLQRPVSSSPSPRLTRCSRTSSTTGSVPARAAAPARRCRRAGVGVSAARDRVCRMSSIQHASSWSASPIVSGQ